MTNELVYSRDIKDFVLDFTERGIWGDRCDYRFDDNCQAFAIANEIDGVVAGLIYHNYNPDAGTIEVSCYSNKKRWLTRKLVNDMLHYPFEDLGLRIVTARFSEDNKFIGTLFKKIGATIHALPELWGVNKDEIVAILNVNDWKKSEIYIDE